MPAATREPADGSGPERAAVADQSEREAFAAALEGRLTVAVQGGHRQPARLQQTLALSRLLERLRRVTDAEWLLKGSYALDLRRPSAAWPGRRAWLVWNGTADEAATAILDASRTDLGDFFDFDVRAASWPRRGRRIVGFRLGSHAGSLSLAEVSLDVRLSESADWEPEIVSGPDLLDFADIAPARLPVLALEEHLAERVLAYARARSGPRQGSHPDLLLEVALLCSSFALSAEQLAGALRRVFERRRGQSPPWRLPPPPGEWLATYRTQVPELGLDSQPGRWYARAALALDPVMGGKTTHGTWDPARLRWETS